MDLNQHYANWVADGLALTQFSRAISQECGCRIGLRQGIDPVYAMLLGLGEEWTVSDVMLSNIA